MAREGHAYTDRSAGQRRGYLVTDAGRGFVFTDARQARMYADHFDLEPMEVTILEPAAGEMVIDAVALIQEDDLGSEINEGGDA